MNVDWFFRFVVPDIEKIFYLKKKIIPGSGTPWYRSFLPVPVIRYILYVYLKQVIKDAIKQFTLNFQRFFLF